MLAPRKTLHSTPLHVFRQALDLVHASTSDVLFDVGCGDGRCVVDAAKRYQMKAIGIEIDEARARQAREAAMSAGVEHLVTIHHGNAMDFDLEQASIVFLFLIERGLRCVQCVLSDSAHLSGQSTSCVQWRWTFANIALVCRSLPPPSRLSPRLQQRSRPCRVVTYLYRIPGIPYLSRHLLRAKDDGASEIAFPVYIYEFPQPTNDGKIDEPQCE
ncbi:hypothetical protein PINS_up003139 [Pythium insidiosum]|nr:hypothetical protein PINS_up003139 [Pythium insidiosum]